MMYLANSAHAGSSSVYRRIVDGFRIIIKVWRHNCSSIESILMFAKSLSIPQRWFRHKVVVSFVSNDSVALTFDDGPDPHITPLVIDILQKHRAKATFFVLGKQAELYPRVIQQILDSGCEIANHSYGHPSFALISPSQRLSEIRKCRSAIGASEKKYFRPPFGHASHKTPLLASLLNYITVCWSADVGDWENLDADVMFKMLETRVTPGSVVLLHDRLETATEVKFFKRDAMLTALDRFLEKTTFSFKTLSEMFSSYKMVESDWDRNFPNSKKHLREQEFANLKWNSF